MNVIIITLIVSIGAVALMMVGLALTRIIKGRDLQSDVGNNDEMKKRGIKCAQQEMREQEAAEKGAVCCEEAIKCGSDCGSCNVQH